MIKRVVDKIKRTVLGPLKMRKIARAIASGAVLDSRAKLQALLGGPALINDPEVPLLDKYAEAARESILEIGCAYGGSSLLFLMNKKAGVSLYSIDPFIKDSMGEFQATYEKCFKFVNRALGLLNMEKRGKDWNLIKDYSFNVVKNWNKPIDLLFIDGDHSYDAVKKDFEDWLPFVAAGGYILFHDSCRPADAPEGRAVRGWPGPTKLANELKTDRRVGLVEQVYSVSVFRKK